MRVDRLLTPPTPQLPCPLPPMCFILHFCFIYLYLLILIISIWVSCTYATAWVRSQRTASRSHFSPSAGVWGKWCGTFQACKLLDNSVSAAFHAAGVMRLQTWAPTASVFMWVPGIGQTQAWVPGAHWAAYPAYLVFEAWSHYVAIWPQSHSSPVSACWVLGVCAPFTLHLPKKAKY